MKPGFPAGNWRAAALALLLAAACVAEIIDRIAISVGNQVITESQIDTEVRLTALLNKTPLNVDLAERKKAAARLIEQALVRRDMEFSRYPMPALSDADASLANLKASLSGEAPYQQELEKYGVTEDELRQRLWWQLTLLRFIDYRFRPGIQIPDSAIQAYYQRQLAQWKQQGLQPVPSLNDARATLEETLTQQGIDEALDRWLSATRTQVQIRYHDEALR